nr:hypothetical protein [Tanacetum cinerariifolium]
NNVSAASPIVPTAGQKYSNSTNPISAAGPLNTNTSPTDGKSLLQDASQPPKMLEREYISYSDHENVGVEADFNNLETSITVSPIPTTRTNKDHPVAQIIGDLSSTTQIRSTGPTWLFDIDSLTRTMNYQPVTAGNQSNPSACFQEKIDAKNTEEKATQQYMLFPLWSTGSSNPQNKEGDATFDGKEHDAEKPESAGNLSLSSSARSGRQDDMTEIKDKGKSLVEYFTGNKDLMQILKIILRTATIIRFTWVFFLATKDETSPILKTFITGLEN